MIELRSVEESLFKQSFAGDVYNSAVYLKRCFPDIETYIVTAVCNDTLSTKMVEHFHSESINTEFVFRDEEKRAGMYLIENDDTGERAFTYWRSDSVARRVVRYLDDEVMENLSSGDMFFFSGISLAVIEAESRPLFWDKLEQLKKTGTTIIFDPNYRPALWSDEDETKALFHKAFELSDIAMPGVEDMSNLYQLDKARDILAFCEPFNLDVVVINNGSQCVVTYANDTKIIHDVTPVDNVVDTTSAGDAFNGAFLGAYLSGHDLSTAVNMATSAAATVIQHPGAIAPEETFKAALPHIIAT